MQSWYIGFSQLISNIWDFISNGIKYFFGLFQTVGKYLRFVVDSINTLPLMVRVPAYIIVTVMVIKFVLNMGKN